MEQKYDVFISYSRKDYLDENGQVIPGNEVSKIIDRFNAEKISYWLDKDKVLSGNDFTEKIIDNIEASRIFVYLSSANANSSKWTKREVAYADDLGKYIIPVQIDNASYNKQVAFHIIDLAFIPYYANPESGLDELITSIKTHLAKQQAEEQKSKEEQQRIIKEIKIDLKTLNNEETKLEADRSTLLAKAERITDTEERDKLKAEIVESSPIYKKLSEERQNLQNKITELEAKLMKANMTEALPDSLTPSEMNKLGNDYYYSRNGKTQDYNMAVEWYRKAAEQGYAIGQSNLGFMYENGYGVNKDYSEAVKWYRKATEQGNANGQNHLGYMYLNGLGVEEDYSEAIKWFRKSAEQGNDHGQANMGFMYEKGYGVPKDIETAKEWYKKAAEQGNDYAKKRLEKLS